jgi:putative phosphoesterase
VASPSLRVGLVADSHGLHDPKLETLLAGCDLVLHAGDVVRPAVLEALARVAPVRAVRGNNDVGPAFAALPEVLVEDLGALRALVVHDLGARGRPSPVARALLARHHPDLVVHGHSHRPGAAVVEGRLVVNPGSCGPRRFSLPRTAALLVIRGRTARVTWHDLAGKALAPFGEAFEAEL